MAVNYDRHSFDVLAFYVYNARHRIDKLIYYTYKINVYKNQAFYIHALCLKTA